MKRAPDSPLGDRRLIIELFRPDGSALGAEFIDLDTEPAREAVRFQHLRLGLDDPRDAVLIEPAWAREGPPFVGGLVARSSQTTCEIPRAYFNGIASDVSASLVQRKRLRAGETCHYRILALTGGGPAVTQPKKSPAAPDPFASVSVEEQDDIPGPSQASVDDLTASAAPMGERHDGDFPAFVPARVIDEASRLTDAARDRETGGILIGFLRRDPARNDVFVEVTAQIPARGAEADRFSLTLDDPTWNDMRAALELRGSGEAMVGWWHSHPGSKYWCNPQCPPEARAKCVFSKNFFSRADADLHRMVFPRAYSVALVVTNTDAGLKYAMFGWRSGVIAQRSFFVLNPTRRLEATTTQNIEGGPDATPCPKPNGAA